MKYAIGIVTYQPDTQRLRENVENAAAQYGAGHIIIVDNGSDNLSEVRGICQSSAEVILIENTENQGVAYALNQICHEAKKRGYEWVVTLDDDSVMQPGTLSEYALYTERQEVGIICPRIEDRHLGRMHTQHDQGVEYIGHCITAGNLVRLKAWEAIGGFSEELFIDGVDFDFCMKLREAGWQILRTNNVCLLQEVGHGRAIHLPFHHQMSILNHSPLRLYYITRNYLYIGRRHHQMLKWVTELIKRMFIVVCFEDNRWQKLQAMWKGFSHFRQGKMGMLVTQ